MLDTIDNTWEDKYKRGAYAALSVACSDLGKRLQALSYYHKTVSYSPVDDGWSLRIFCHAGKYYLRDFQHDKAIFMFEGMTLFGIFEGPNDPLQIWENIFIGNVLLNKGNTDVEAIEKFKLALKILKKDIWGDFESYRMADYQAHL